MPRKKTSGEYLLAWSRCLPARMVANLLVLLVAHVAFDDDDDFDEKAGFV